jgi:PEP-CTERM putative exosortase interaction domain
LYESLTCRSHGALVVASGAGSRGEVELKKGTMTSGSAVVGGVGVGQFQQTGGKHNVLGSLILAESGGSQGKYHLSRSTLNVGGDLRIGVGGQGEFGQRGGTVSVTGAIEVIKGSFKAGSVDTEDKEVFPKLTAGRISIGTGASFEVNNGKVQVADGISVGAGGSFKVTGTNSRIRIGGNFLIDKNASANFAEAELVIAKGAESTLSINENQVYVRKLTLETNVTFTLDGDLGKALYVEVFDIGNNGLLRLDSYVIGNGLNIYYDSENDGNLYLLGQSYKLGNGGWLAPKPTAESSGTLSATFFPTVGVVPEPSTVLLLGSGLAVLLLRRRMNR